MSREPVDQEVVLAQAEAGEGVGGDNKKKKKKRRKTPQIGFAILAQTIGAKWKTIDPARLNAYKAMAKEEKELYKRECDAYRAQQAQDVAALLEQGE